MSNALLLRLFTSEYFNSWIAVSYIFRYPDNVGIQHYLCRELGKFPIEEYEFFLPQLLHLLITRPTESVALEFLIYDKCKESTHVAILTLWSLQAYLTNLLPTPHTPQFTLCKRIFNKVQSIAFSADLSALDDGSITLPSQKVSEHVAPALVGIGAVLAGIAHPLITEETGRVAIAQGRRNRLLELQQHLVPSSRRKSVVGNGRQSTEPKLSIEGRRRSDDHDEERRHRRSSNSSITSFNDLTRKKVDGSKTAPGLPLTSLSQPNLSVTRRPSLNELRAMTMGSPSLEDLHQGKAFSVKRYLRQAQYKLSRAATSPDDKHQILSVFDPSITTMANSSVPVARPSSPTISPSTKSPQRHRQNSPLRRSESTDGDADETARKLTVDTQSSSDTLKDHVAEYHGRDGDSSEEEDEAVFQSMSLAARKQLLKSNYFHSEMQFLLALSDIATRLVIVPKSARLSTLHAELTLLNHNLPAEVCIPLWCSATPENPHHHRVLRISSVDAVVLNSAERAPYLLFIEVLEGAMSFDDAAASSMPKRRKWSSQNALDFSQLTSPPTLDASPKVSTSDDGSTTQSRTSVEKDMQSEASRTSRGESNATQHITNVTQTDSLPETPIPSPLDESDEKKVALVIQSPPSRRSSNSADDFAEKMRTAAIMLAQLQKTRPLPVRHNSSRHSQSSSNQKARETEEIRQKIIVEMMALEEKRMQKMKREGVGSGVGGTDEAVASEAINEDKMVDLTSNDDPSAAVFRESWDAKRERIREASPYGHLPNWRLLSVIIKNAADLRQEQFACQLIREMQRIWQDEGVDVWVKYFRILVTSDNSGVVETIRDSISIHSIKKNAYAQGLVPKGTMFTLYDYFVQTFGAPTSEGFLKAQDAFMRSLTGYSIACHILQIKDRHNGNILLDKEGHLIHIDFGFMLSNSPGSVGFEMAPFKLPQEYLDILLGPHSEKFAEYKALMKLAFLSLRKHAENIILLVEMMQNSSRLPCFQSGGPTIVAQLRERFQLGMTEPQVEEYVDRLVMS
ncbi:hypothetical protein BZG36_04702, partial [Bifiguratus adelaidae]